MVTKKQNKSAFVRKILADIGALDENPPDGWREKVEKALSTNGLKMHTVTIYQLRRKAMNNGLKNTTKAKIAAVSPTTVSKADSLTLANIKEIAQFAEKFGGLSGLAEGVAALQSIKG